MTLGDFDDRALLLLDGCSCHTNEEFRELLERHNVTMRFLVPHTSHLTQPLDVGIFGRVKNLIRSTSRYVINLRDLDEALAREVDAEVQGRRPSVERGKMLADFILNILQAFHQATTPELVVSAFELVGICSRGTEGNVYTRRETFVDPTRARLVIAETALFRRRDPVPNARHRQLEIADLNSFVQSQMARDERQPERRALPPTPASCSAAPSHPAPRVRRPLLPVGFPSAFRPVQSLSPSKNGQFSHSGPSSRAGPTLLPESRPPSAL